MNGLKQRGKWGFGLKAGLGLLVALGALGSGTVRAAGSTPRLVLVISVDQFRSEYLERFSPAFSHGLATFRQKGVIFEDGHQDHASTATGPGHTTLSTGAYPRTSGIVGNQWYEEDGTVRMYCVQDDSSPLVGTNGVIKSAGRSPRNLGVTALSDWIKDRDPESKAFAVSRKDRSAVLLGGKSADAAFWFDPDTGEFVSSMYYLKELPAWLNALNQKRLPLSYFGKAWTPLEVTPELLQQTHVEPTNFGWFEGGFPHAIGNASPAPNAAFFNSFGGTPYMDRYLLELVKLLITEEKLGRDDHVDYLGVSFSVLDSVGHSYGPHSPEVLDVLRHLDRVFGELFEFVEQEIGMDKVLIAFSSDHGVMDLPEYRQSKGQEGRRMGDAEIECLQKQGLAFSRIYGQEEEWFRSGFYLNLAAVGRHNLLREDVEREAARLLEECSFVRKVWTRTEMERPSSDPFHRLFRNSYVPGKSSDLIIQPRENFLGSLGLGTSHGSPYRYDTHVPIVFLIPGASPARIVDRAATVDIAPTLAAFLDLKVPESADGRDLRPFFGRLSDAGSGASGTKAEAKLRPGRADH